MAERCFAEDVSRPGSVSRRRFPTHRSALRRATVTPDYSPFEKEKEVTLSD